MSTPLHITVEVPEAIVGESAAQLAARARLLLVIDEIRLGRMTRAGGARALGMSLDDFLIAAGEHGLLAIDYDLDDFRSELDGISAAGQ